MFTAVIEIPKGDDRRRHLNYAKTAFEDFGPIKDLIPINSGVMPIAYGFIKDTLNKEEGDKEEQVDVLVFSDRQLTVAQELPIEPIALLELENKDHKVIARDLEGQINYQTWEEVPNEEKELLFKFFGYKSPIEAIKDRKVAVQYLKNSLVDLN